MNLEVFPVGQLQTNSYLIWDKNENAVIVDPGADGDFLSEQVLSRGLNLHAILLTHGHFDHVLGILPLKLNYNPAIYLTKEDLPLYKKAVSSARYWLEGGDFDPPPPPDAWLEEGRVVAFGDLEFQVISAPGHTPGGVCFYMGEFATLFTGDTLFAGGVVGRTDLSYSNKDELSKSIKILSKLPEDTIIYPGIGGSDRLGDTISKINWEQI